ncbi:High affinity sulfate transporter 2 [Glycine soja]
MDVFYFLDHRRREEMFLYAFGGSRKNFQARCRWDFNGSDRSSESSSCRKHMWFLVKKASDTSFVCPLVYAIMGSSRDISIVPVVVVSLLLGTLLTDEISDFKSHEYLRLAGATQMALDVLRLGFLIDFLSHASIVGFMDRAAITIALQQLKGFLGIKTFTKKTDIVSVMRSVFNAAHHGWNCKTIVIAVAFLAFLLITKYINFEMAG